LTEGKTQGTTLVVYKWALVFQSSDILYHNFSFTIDYFYIYVNIFIYKTKRSEKEMANNFEKILTIEQQIEKLKEKQKRLEEQMQLNIGRELLKVWDVDSEEEALRWVQELAVHVNGENKTRQDEVMNNEG
jgi:hypothetical protein